MKRCYLIIALLVMCFNSLYQYSWNVFEPLLAKGFGVEIVSVQIAFTLFAVFSTTFQGIGGYFADRDGPRNVSIAAALMSAFGFVASSLVHSIYLFYVIWSIGSIGEGILYGIATNLAVKWYSGRRGFAVGFVSLGFGLGSSIANIFLEKASEFRFPMMFIGLAELIVLPLLLSFVKYPSSGLTGERPSRNIKNPRFWILYLSFVFGSIPLIVISSSFGFIGSKLPELEFAVLVSIFPLLSGISRPIIGAISDAIGRPASVLLIDVAIFIGALFLVLRNFIFAVVLIGFFGGSMISLYFSLIGDVFGTRFSTANNGIFYTGKAVSGFMGSTLFAIIFTLGVEYSFYFVFISAIFGIAFLIISMAIVHAHFYPSAER
ncbi:hypothetical protein [Thermoplasma volcanium GSS1]|uniref:Major facilitator superfamily (MFS) profile domain-containing protein n=1 Tax=Thermoplasma volcanium (strain ATCC 51530 / DSM 4299 / JCM 9571 / NBRC 15438 / GSS1) TaxID=273116 RepID=Q978J3_THEVO|nr:OFA family MFS transporter [Thermoplasma volcanium]BAB60564.1 hypothetical protein [Thermoplasma volcanium GSS1]